MLESGRRIIVAELQGTQPCAAKLGQRLVYYDRCISKEKAPKAVKFPIQNTPVEIVKPEEPPVVSQTNVEISKPDVLAPIDADLSYDPTAR